MIGAIFCDCRIKCRAGRGETPFAHLFEIPHGELGRQGFQLNLGNGGESGGGGLSECVGGCYVAALDILEALFDQLIVLPVESVPFLREARLDLRQSRFDSREVYFPLTG